MYKKIIFLTAALITAFIVSGCSKYSTRIEITNNDKAIINQILAVDAGTLESNSPSYDPKDPFKSINDFEIIKKKEQEYRAKGYEVLNYRKENYVGRELKKTFMRAQLIKPENLPEGLFVFENESYPITLKRNPYVSEYSIHMKFDPEKLKNLIVIKNNNQEDNINYASPVADLTIKIPRKAFEHNATTVDEKKCEYTWVLQQNGTNQIILKYKKINFIGILFTIIAIIATIIVFNNNKQYIKGKDEDSMNAF